MVSQHPAITLFFRANFEKICERALTPLSFGGYSCNIQNLKGRFTATTIGFDIILEPVPDFSLRPEMGGYLHASHASLGADKIISSPMLVTVSIPIRF